jgi:hypothetical protein
MGILLLLAAIGMLCVLLFNFAVYAVPAFVGFSAFFWAVSSGAGIGSAIVGIGAGAIVFALGQLALASRYAVLRWLVILVFTVPAAYAGYSIVMELSELGMIPSPLWQHIFAVLAGLAVAGTTVARLVAPLPGLAARPGV